MKELVRREGVEKDFYIDSAGLYGGHAGALPDERMRKHASQRGYLLDSRARAFYPSADFADFDMIVGMDEQNIRELQRLAVNDEERKKIFRMTDFCQVRKDYHAVPDPYYSGADGFELVLDLLEDAVGGLYEYCRKNEI